MSLGLVYLLSIPPTLALTLPSTQGFFGPPTALSMTSSTSPGPSSLTLDSPTLSLNLSRNDEPVICNGSLLGFDINRYGCLEAVNTIPRTTRPVTFGARGKGTFEVQLPRRFSSRDGTCVIDIFHRSGVIADTTSYLQISNAAERVYSTCVNFQGQRSQGGWIRKLGQEENLIVVLSSYTPFVSCFGPYFRLAIADEVLQNLLAVIPASTERKVFGPDGEPGVQVVLPFVYTVSTRTPPLSHRLRLTVDVEHRNAVTARGFDIWAGGVAVSAICMARGSAGIAGLASGLSVTLEALPELGVGNITAVF